MQLLIMIVIQEWASNAEPDSKGKDLTSPFENLRTPGDRSCRTMQTARKTIQDNAKRSEKDILAEELAELEQQTQAAPPPSNPASVRRQVVVAAATTQSSELVNTIVHSKLKS